MNSVTIAKALCIQLEEARERQKYHKNNYFRELFCKNVSQDGIARHTKIGVAGPLS